MGIVHTCFSDVEPDPSLASAKAGAAAMRAFEPDCIIALGGGSAMDAGKIMWVMYEHPDVDFADMDQMVPVALMLIAMPISSSIGHAIGLGLISYTVIKVFSGKAKDVSVLTYVISALFLVKFFLVV